MYGESLKWQPWKPAGKIDNVPLPSPEMLLYVERHNTLRLNGLVLHMLTTSVVADTLIQGIQNANKQKPSSKQITINPNIVLETMAAYHAPRPLAIDGLNGLASTSINEFMKSHDDIDLSTFIATLDNLPVSVTQTIEELQRARGFPSRTIGPDNLYNPGAIEWNAALTQIASWSVAGTILPMEKRFEDLIKRHTDTPDSPKKLTRSELDAYRLWGMERAADISFHIGILPEDLYGWLRGEINNGFSPETAKSQSDTLIRQLFQRESEDNEFLPISSAYGFLARSIMERGHPRSRLLKRMFSKPERALKLYKQFGLIYGDNGVYNTTSTLYKPQS